MWKDGIYYPRWLPASFQGYGSPAFYFYPPLIYFFASIFHLLVYSLSAILIYKILLLLLYLASLFSFFLFLKSKNLSFGPSIFGAILYAFAPYRYLDANVRGAIAEHAIFVWLPVLLWGIDQCREGSRTRSLAIVAISTAWAAILMTNIPGAVVVGFGILLLILNPIAKQKLHFLQSTFTALFLGALLAGISLLPALQFGSDIHRDLFSQRSYSVGYSNAPLFDIFSGKSITLNVIGVLTLCAAFVLLFELRGEQQRSSSLDRRYRSVLWLVIVIQLPYISSLLFKFFKPAVLVQFPWRFDIWIIPIFSLACASALQQKNRTWTTIVLLLWEGALVLMLCLNGLGLSIHRHPAEFDPTWEYFVPRWVPVQHDVPMAGPLEGVWANHLQIGESLTDLTRRPLSDSVITFFNVPHYVKFHRYFWREWRASVDGMQTTVFPDSAGIVTAVVPSGHHLVALKLETSTSENAGLYLSLLGAALIIYFGFRSYREHLARRFTVRDRHA